MSSTALDRTSPMPLWAQLEAALRIRLEQGEFDVRFPTDAELVETYGVSRHTVRDAVRNLNRTGVLRRERGRGTIVNRQQFEQSPGTLYSLFNAIESTGVTQTSEVLRLEIVTSASAAARLQVASDEPLVLLERVRLAGDSPLAVDRTWLIASIASGLLDVDFRHTALYDELERVAGVRPNRGNERITPIVPPPVDRKLLQLRSSDAAFFVERSGQYNSQVLEWRETTIRGDRYRFVTEWSASSTESLRLAPSV